MCRYAAEKKRLERWEISERNKLTVFWFCMLKQGWHLSAKYLQRGCDKAAEGGEED